MSPSHLEKLKNYPYLLTSDAAKLNTTRAALSRAVEKGQIEKLQRGLYGYIDREESEMQSFADVSARAPNIAYPSIQIARSRETEDFGVISTQVDGVPVLVTDVERTVVDCFKFRNKIGIDVAIEALTEAKRANKLGQGKLWKYAKRYRMTNIMMP